VPVRLPGATGLAAEPAVPGKLFVRGLGALDLAVDAIRGRVGAGAIRGRSLLGGPADQSAAAP
jgi:hypothetical protein